MKSTRAVTIHKGMWRKYGWLHIISDILILYLKFKTFHDVFICIGGLFMLGIGIYTKYVFAIVIGAIITLTSFIEIYISFKNKS